MPVRILILTAGYGEGHNTAARCLAAAFRHLRPDLEVEVCDPLAECYGSTNDFLRRAYITAINKAPRLWQAIYWVLDRTPIVRWSQWTAAKMERWLARKLHEERPAVICTTYPAYNFTLERIFRKDRAFPTTFATVVTDSITINSLWTQAPGDVYYVPNPATAAIVIRQGIPAGSVHALGFPVQLDFALPERRAEPPELEGGPLRVLYILNSGRSQVDEVVTRLLRLPGIHLTLAVGRDEKLRDRLARLTAAEAARVELIGWTDQMPRLMMTHHVLITKAGGATVQEALAAGTPLILSQVVPGQEEGNWFLVRDLDAGALAPGPEALARTLEGALADGAAVVRRWRANIRRAHTPDAALRIAGDLIQRAGI